MQIELSAFIEADLDAIAAWIAEDNPTRALTFLQEIRGAMRRIGANPFLYRVRPEIGVGARLAIVDNYVILFRISSGIMGEWVRVERVVFGGRHLPDFMQ